MSQIELFYHLLSIIIIGNDAISLSIKFSGKKRIKIGAKISK